MINFANEYDNLQNKFSKDEHFESEFLFRISLSQSHSIKLSGFLKVLKLTYWIVHLKGRANEVFYTY